MYFVLDLGGTNFRISWAKSLGDIDVAANIFKLSNTGDYRHDSGRIVELMKSKSSSASGIVIALPGQFDHEKKILHHANNLEAWIGKPFFRQLESEFGCSLIVDRDTTVAAIGEGLNNKLTGSEFLYISWGTGVGGCLVSVNTGHLPQVKILDWKNTFSQIETLCGGGYAVTNFGVELNYLNDAQWDVLINNFVQQVTKICDQLGLRLVVLGGGITAKREDIVSEIIKELNKNNVVLLKSTLGDLSAIYGGYALLQFTKENI